MSYQKNNKYLVKKCRPICKVSVCGKMFECLLCNSLLYFLIQSDIISPAQSGFKPGDSGINKLSSIMCQIYHSMDEGWKIGISCYNITSICCKDLIRYCMKVLFLHSRGPEAKALSLFL